MSVGNDDLAKNIPEATQALKQLILQERIDEVERIDAGNISNGIDFHTHDRAVNNGWKTMKQYTKWRIAQLKAQLKGVK